MSPPSIQALRVPSLRDDVLPPAAAQLNTAFELFNELSEQLAETYRAMEERVGELNRELHVVAEQRLKELQEKERFAARLQSLLTLLPAGVVLIDRYGRVADSNPAARELLGQPLDGERWLDVIARAFAPRGDDGHEISLRDGRRIGIATRSLDGEAGQLLLLTDLTETRALQQRLARHQRLSEMGRMMSSLAHQIRTPLSAAMLYAGHLSERDLSAEQTRRFSRKVLERLTHLEQQVRDMLIFVRGDVRLTDTFNAAELFTALQAAAEMPVAAAAAECEWHCPASEAVVHGNREVLVSALMNLVNNALQAAGRGAQLRIAAVTADSQLIVSVRDNGPGFDAEVAKHLNETFFTSKPQGTGLGLAVVRAVAEAHGGNFDLSCEPGRGACATLRLPLFTALHAPGNGAKTEAPDSETRMVETSCIETPGIETPGIETKRASS